MAKQEISTPRLMELLKRQLEVWPMASDNFDALKKIETRHIMIDGTDVTLQHNPARIRSTAAKVDKAAVASRPCFLCDCNRPPEQLELAVEDGKYKVLVNPFPIFPVHFTIPAASHEPQLITADGGARFADMFAMASSLDGLALFYNGPHCGASAPDHFHFQAVETSDLPLLGWIAENVHIPFKVHTALFSDVNEAGAWFAGVCHDMSLLPENQGEPEPRMNIICAAVGNGRVRVAVIPRRAHRPDFYGTGDNRLLLSPASVDLAGVVVVPSPDDFHSKLTAEVLRSMYEQTCYAV